MFNTKDLVAEINNELESKSFSLGDNLEKISLNDLISEYSVRKENGHKVAVVTITGLVSVVSKFEGKSEQQYCIFTFAENPAQFSTCAGDMPKLYNKLMNLSNNNLREMNESLKATPARVEIWKTKTQNNFTYTKIKMLEFVVEAEKQEEVAAEAPPDDNPFDLF